MIDLKRLRADDEYRRGIERKRVRPGLIDDVLANDRQMLEPVGVLQPKAVDAPGESRGVYKLAGEALAGQYVDVETVLE